MIAYQQLFEARSEKGDELRADEALRILQNAFPPSSPPEGYVLGRTQMRNTLAEKSGCSLLHAEELILVLDRRGNLQFDGNPQTLETGPASWSIDH